MPLGNETKHSIKKRSPQVLNVCYFRAFFELFQCMISRLMSDGEVNPMARLVAIISDAFLYLVQVEI
jgi:hypothetical protein